MTIEVTAEDIANGLPHSACFCPIALAIKRTANAKDVEVGYNGVGIGNQEYWHNASLFIRAFDLGVPVAPCTVTLTEMRGW